MLVKAGGDQLADAHRVLATGDQEGGIYLLSPDSGAEPGQRVT